ncbi:hypothetical protein [Nostoc sp.]
MGTKVKNFGAYFLMVPILASDAIASDEVMSISICNILALF